MKKLTIALFLTIGIGAVIALNSCKKETTPVATDGSVSAQDNEIISKAVNTTSDDAVSAAGNAQGQQGKAGMWHGMPFFCGISVVDTGRAGHSITTITYDGTTACNGIIRAGSITIYDTSGLVWADAGAFITVTYNTLKVNDVATGNGYVLGGSYTITKETAGLEWQVMAGLVTNTTVTTIIKGGLSVTFGNGQYAMWMFDRGRSWASAMSAKQNIITVSVFAVALGKVDVSGVTRNGEMFTSTIEQAIEANSNISCRYLPYSGETKLVVQNNHVLTVLYGTNREGVQIGTPTTCGDGYYITCTGGKTTYHNFIAYL